MITTPTRVLAAALLSTVSTAVLVTSANAHATFEQATAQAGSTYRAVLRVPHGCDGEPTIAVRLELPEGFINAKPMPKPGWELAVEEAAFEKNYDYHDEAVSSGPVAIVWSGGELADAYYDEFVVRGTLAGFEAGETATFRAVQDCPSGAQAIWEGMDAPSVRILAAAGGGGHAHHRATDASMGAADTAMDHSGHGHSGHGDMAAGDAKATNAAGASATVGDIAIEAAWTRQSPPGARAGGGYATITNTGTEPDRLIGGSAPFSERFEVHEMSVTDGVMRMSEIDGGLEIGPGETVTLRPGGFHLMFMGLTEPPVEGTSVPVTLFFERAGTVTLDLPVAAIGATSPGGSATEGGLATEGGPAMEGGMGHGAMDHGGHDHGAMDHGTGTGGGMSLATENATTTN